MSRPAPSQAPRGIAPELLLSQVRNTAPYVFDEGVIDTPPATFVRELDRAMPASLSHAEYFRLCVSAHYLTCATPVPTDVDNQIRRKLWAPGLPLVTALEMGRLVLESRGWDFTPLTSRASYGAKGTEWEHVPLHGHAGEWFTVAAGAYAALGQYRAADAKTLRASLLEAIARETEQHSQIFGSLWRAKDGVGALLASVSIAHNFGDLDRVIDMWDLPITDPLRRDFHGLTTSPFDAERNLRHMGRLWTAGELYKSVIDGSSMALENHRHFALRKPRGLRARPELRVPLGPFFDAWGARVATMLEGESLLETIDALVAGCERMPTTAGYARALHAIREARPELHERSDALTKSAHFRALLETPRDVFEARWNDAALTLLDEIPGRA
ncbi:hypothetical protein [Sandaracinus amylolyticus]|uniref:Uncharacterized protein n=1 Tax=Sandaracinus amylolyticus TaxID=927083 RepID=A0A0F6W3X5_9BACT|nr:hypothetical protein [Sandaracinus amylolyticus]AKF06767.1 hypothetical protein DB32_003916 [Sandaracinus amylolyticus]